MYPAGAAAAPARQAASRVDKATSHLLMGPDWAVNLEICDIINADVWQTKDVVKAVKKRLQNKDPKVHYYALTLLETMMKNCGEYVQLQVAEQHVLNEMVKIIQKKLKWRSTYDWWEDIICLMVGGAPKTLSWTVT